MCGMKTAAEHPTLACPVEGVSGRRSARCCRARAAHGIDHPAHEVVPANLQSASASVADEEAGTIGGSGIWRARQPAAPRTQITGME